MKFFLVPQFQLWNAYWGVTTSNSNIHNEAGASLRVKSFIKNENRVLELIERSFLSPKAKERYVALYLDRLRAVRYQFIK